MKKTTFKVTFLLRKNKPFSNGEVPILIRITLNGERVEFVGKHSVNPALWNQRTNRAMGNSMAVKSLNTYLDHVYIKLCDSMRDLEERGVEVTAANIRDNYLGIISYKQVTLFSAYDEHNEKMKALIGKGYTYATLERHYTTRTHLQNFVRLKYNKDDIPLERVDNVFVTDFEFFLRSEKNIGNNTTVKYLRNLGKVLRIAFDAGHIKKNPLSTVRLHIEDIDRPFLDEIELQTLFNKMFSCFLMKKSNKNIFRCIDC